MWKSMLVLLLAGGGSELPGETFWQALESLCGKAFEGRMVEGTEASDAAFAAERMVMHVAECSETEIRIPFQVGENRSRTWVLTRSADGLRLKHDHRHEDGSPDRITFYGGDAVDAEGRAIDFPADAHTANMLPAAASNTWTLSITPGEQFSYALRREAENRRFKVVFDLLEEIPPPPPAW